jgi:hypothetical protein
MMKLSQSSRGILIGAAVLAGLLGVFYFSFLGGTCFLWEDLLYMAHPAYNYLTDAVASGRFPLWLSGLRCGIPFFSEPWVYYPPVWALSLWVHDGHLSSQAIQWFFVGQLFLGGVFAFIFLKDLKLSLGACLSGMVVFVFSAFLSLHIIHGGMGHAFLWMPLELLFVKRIVERRKPWRNAVYLVLSIWMSFLVGFPQSVVYNAYFLGAYWLFLAWQENKGSSSFRWWSSMVIREGFKVAGVFLIVGLLGVFVILPTVQSWSMSLRQEFGFAQIADQSLPWYYLIHGFVPNFFGAVNGDGGGVPFWGFNKDTLEYATWHGGAWMYWEFGFYAGQLALIAIAVMAFNVRRLWADRREAIFFLAMIPLVLWLMLGRYGGLFNLFYHIAPGFSMFRTPARIGCLFDFSAAVLVAFLVDAVMRGKPVLELRRPLLALGGIYGILICGVLLYGGDVFPELKDPRLFSHAATQMGLSVGLFMITAILLVWIKGRGERQNKNGAKIEGGSGWMTQALVWSLVVLTFFDLYLAFHKFHQGQTKPEEYYADRNGLIAKMTKMREQEGPFRFAQLRDGKISEEVVFPRNIGYLYPGYEALEGYIVFNLKEYAAFNSITNERVRLDIQNVGVMANLDSRTRQVGLMRYTNSLPRAKFYHDVRAYADTKGLCADLEAGRLDYHRTLGVLSEECVKYGVSTATPPAGAVAKIHFTPINSDKYEISYQTTAPGVIFISESFYPGWEANAGQYPVIHAFGAFKGIVIPEAGSGVITVKFSPKVLWIGLTISGVTLSILLAILGVLLCRSRSPASHSNAKAL